MAEIWRRQKNPCTCTW